MENNINNISFNKNYNPLNKERLSNSYRKRIAYNKDSETIIKLNKFTQYLSDNDNDDNLINSDSTQEDTTKAKYIYKKKLNRSKIIINHFKPKNQFYNINNQTNLDTKKNFKHFITTSNNLEFITKNKIKSNLNYDNKIICVKIDINKINNSNDNNIYEKNDDNNNERKNKKEKISKINKQKGVNNYVNIEELLLFEDKFSDLINSINKKKDISNECLDLIEKLFNSSLCQKFEIYFNKNHKSQNIIIYKSIVLMIFSTILSYHISFDNSFFHICLDYLAIIININHKTYLLLCEYIINQFKNTLNDNNYYQKLLSILKKDLSHLDLKDKDYAKYLTERKYITNKKTINSIHEIKYYSFLILKYIKVLLKNLNTSHKVNLDKIFDNINDLSFEEIFIFFQKNIKIKKNSRKNYLDLNKFSPTNPEIKSPFIKTKLSKKFSLVLDLDETLISLDRENAKENKAILKFRPGLLNFLSKMKKYYEIIVFTSATKEYADQIEDVIEQNEKYFEFRLYREHTLSFNNEFIKDISRIGRPLDKILIVDNMPQNYRMQKENGIGIKSFFGEDEEDDALEYLGIILIKIINNFDDVREGISEYKNEIISNISGFI